MGQKINPNGLRVGINKNWNSRWSSVNGKEFASNVIADEKIRKYFFNKYVYAKPISSKAEKINAQIVSINIERNKNVATIFITCGQPGIIQDQKNIDVDKLNVAKILGRQYKFEIKIIKYENICWSARVMAREIADDIENRVSFRNAQKKVITKVMNNKALGIKTVVSGRLGGVDMARHEGYTHGVVPLTTLRADIDYAIEKAHTVSGIIGVKVWINRGIILDKGLDKQIPPPPPANYNKKGGPR